MYYESYVITIMFCYWDNGNNNLSFLPDLLALFLTLSDDETLFSNNHNSTKSHNEIHEQGNQLKWAAEHLHQLRSSNRDKIYTVHEIPIFLIFWTSR